MPHPGIERAVFVVFSAALASLAAAEFGTFNVFAEHPLAAWLNNGSVNPVPLHQYYYTNPTSGRVHMRRSTQFVPQGATYRLKRRNGPTLFQGADALTAVGMKGKVLTLKLNRNCKVVVILNKFGRGPNRTPAVTSPAGYTGEAKVRLVRSMSAKTGKRMVWGGYAISTFPKKVDGRMEYVLQIPHASEFKIAGTNKKATAYTILLIDPASTRPQKGFAPPSTPQHILNAPNGGRIVPKARCPEALHDQWKATSGDHTDLHNFVGEDRAGDMVDHTTWHPTIDPVYYCSYMHDHGSYPGRHYKPAYTHTAWHTKDETQEDHRQDESDAGFKTFAIVDQTTSLHWVITVHMELGNPRRFSTDFHTIQIAIFNVTAQDIWTLQVELNYKQDYGFAATRIKRAGSKRRPLVALTSKDQAIRNSQKARGIGKRFRQFNVNKWSPVCNFSLNKGDVFATTPKKKRNIRFGSNEHWTTSLNTCGNNRFRIDVARPATGLQSCDTGANQAVDELHGNSLRRTLTSLGAGLEVGAGLCSFDEGKPPCGCVDHPVKFYTDSHFTKVVNGPGKFHLAQWMVPGFRTKLTKGTYRPVNPWNGEFSKGKLGSNFQNIEGWSVKGSEN